MHLLVYAEILNEQDQVHAKCNATNAELKRATMAEKESQEELARAKKTLATLNGILLQERKAIADWKTQNGALYTKFQKVKGERNTFKLKSDSLSKEMARICRNGMGVADIEQIMLDHETMRMEVSTLRTQKRRALEQLDEIRRAHDDSIQAQMKAGINGEAMRALEQKAVLERVVSELTEYVNAKEMQLETLKEVNKALTDELQAMAKQNIGKNEI